ncbi:4-hydroxy-tetrahydrodipicolinate synthase [Anaerolineae bacterium]|nr:4-hydroxy-tetrahydrodipicolinate synthase [Anaerolineae bacterium]
MHFPKGIICPLATPLDSGENLDLLTLRQLLDRILPGLDAVFVLGSSGEFAALKEQTARQIVDATLEYVNGRVPVYVGIADTSTARVIENLQRVARGGATAVVATSPYYYPLTDQASLINHFTRIADASELPLILYNIPQNTHIHLTPASVHQLAHHPNIIGMKDSWGDMILFQEFLHAQSNKFAVLQGREQLAAASLWLGAVGIVSTVGNFAPEMLQRIVSAVRAGNHAEALVVQHQVTDLARVFDQGYWLAAMKTVLLEIGIGTGRMAQPFPDCTPEQRRTIHQILKQAGLLKME